MLAARMSLVASKKTLSRGKGKGEETNAFSHNSVLGGVAETYHRRAETGKAPSHITKSHDWQSTLPSTTNPRCDGTVRNSLWQGFKDNGYTGNPQDYPLEFFDSRDTSSYLQSDKHPEHEIYGQDHNGAQVEESSVQQPYNSDGSMV